MAALEKLKPLYDGLYKIIEVVCKMLLIADIVVVSMTVLGRYVPFIPDPSWSEEITLTLICLLYTSWMGQMRCPRNTGADKRLPLW